MSKFPVKKAWATLRDEGFAFLEEEPLPAGYRAGEIVL